MPNSPAVYRARHASSQTGHQQGRYTAQVKPWRNTQRYKRLAEAFWLQERNQSCAECGIDLVVIARQGRVIDHKQPHRGDYGAFWDQGNWQPMCSSCHGRKSSRERSV